jgi:hypothetical protein
MLLSFILIIFLRDVEGKYSYLFKSRGEIDIHPSKDLNFELFAVQFNRF